MNNDNMWNAVNVSMSAVRVQKSTRCQKNSSFFISLSTWFRYSMGSTGSCAKLQRLRSTFVDPSVFTPFPIFPIFRYRFHLCMAPNCPTFTFWVLSLELKTKVYFSNIFWFRRAKKWFPSDDLVPGVWWPVPSQKQDTRYENASKNTEKYECTLDALKKTKETYKNKLLYIVVSCLSSWLCHCTNFMMDFVQRNMFELETMPRCPCCRAEKFEPQSQHIWHCTCWHIWHKWTSCTF